MCDIDSIIERLLEAREFPKQKQLNNIGRDEIIQVFKEVQQVLATEPTLLDLQAPLKIVGDIRGYFYKLLHLFDTWGYPPEQRYLFLGNYVDFGEFSIESMLLLLSFKIKYPDKIFLLRGSHEWSTINRIYGFYDECKRRFDLHFWRDANRCLNHLPLAAIIDGRIFCVHSGLSPEMQSVEQIRLIERPLEIPDQGLIVDLLWAHIKPKIWGWVDSDRGISYRFGPDVVHNFLHTHNLDLIVCSNKKKEGYEIVADRKMVKLFGVSKYLEAIDNVGAVAWIHERGVISFQTLDPQPKAPLWGLNYEIQRPENPIDE